MGETQTAAESIVQTSNALIDLAEKERELVELIQEQPEYKRIEVVELLKRIVQDMRDKYPSATIKITCPDAVTVRATTKFSRGIRELITNAVVHNDASSPEISVDVTAGGDESVIAVIDNGSKIPEMERELLTNGGNQTKLYHGSGLGLSLIRLLITRAGGNIRFEEPPTTGNKIILEIPNT
jgi:Signal transduction histidine kinase